MTNLPSNLPTLLRAAGLTVVEVDGWRTRGRPASTGGFDPVGVLNHHTGASARGWSRAKELAYAIWMFLTGRPSDGLPAPLCQIALGRSGVVYLGAAGRANHAGTARASGSVSSGDGNRLYIGIEWMLSGFEAIPAAMMQAGLTLNAVLVEKVTDTSVETVSCHYNTSVTGKWDIGDPLGVPYNGHKVLDVPKFRSAVAARRKALYHKPAPKPERDSIIVNLGHSSLQFSDNLAQWKHDCEAVFSRGYVWLTGTEAGSGDNYAVLRAAAKKYGYRVVRYKSNWIAVKANIVKRLTWKVETKTVVDSDLTVGKGHDTSYIVVTFEHRDAGVGVVSIVCSHYPTKGRPDIAANPNLPWTTKIGNAVSKVATSKAKGPALAFFGGDVNIVDRISDVFFGGPLTTCWDERDYHPNTGHGNIDVIASHDHDGRVKCLDADVYTDRELMLYTDHFLIDAKYRITLSRQR